MHGANRGSLYSREGELLRQIVTDYPQDLQGRIFLANAGGSDSLAVLEAVLRQDPDNSAANHYYIHALESTGHPEKALHSADILGRLAPSSAHMVHMPGHIYFRVGDYERAAQAFAAALALDRRYMYEQHVDPDNNWNYVHNLMYSIANLLEEGKFDEATRLSAEITSARGKLDTTLYPYMARDSISRLDPRLPVALRIGDFPLILKLANAARIGAGLRNLEFLRVRLADFASGMQAVAEHNLPEAERISARFDAELRRMKDQNDGAAPTAGMAGPQPPASGWPKLAVMSDALLDPLLKTFSIMLLELRGSLQAHQGQTADAQALFVSAAKQEMALGYREPPYYIRPVGETEGAAMLAAQDWTAAKAAFERALAERPHSGLSLYGIALACERSGDRETAVQITGTSWRHGRTLTPRFLRSRMPEPTWSNPAGRHHKSGGWEASSDLSSIDLAGFRLLRQLVHWNF